LVHGCLSQTNQPVSTFLGEGLVRRLQETIESKRARWRSKCEIEAKEKYRELMRRNAKIMREQAPRFAFQVNWFSPLPIYNHTAHSNFPEWGYCQATGQERKKVSAFLRAKKQEPVEYFKWKGAGRPLPLYSFETNLLVLDKLLSDWLPNARSDQFQYRESSMPGKIFVVPEPERVCKAIDGIVRFVALKDHAEDQSRLLLGVLRNHLNRCKGRVKDAAVCRWVPRLEARITPAGFARLGKELRMRRAERIAMRQAGYEFMDGKWVLGEPKATGPMPYAEIRQAFERCQEFLG
jgi:hypothetical protein